jgi:pantoate--beta-alanine ligase
MISDRIAATRGAVLDYAEVVDADSLQPVAELPGTVMVALAVRFGSTRLIDNEIIEIPATVTAKQ